MYYYTLTLLLTQHSARLRLKYIYWLRARSPAPIYIASKGQGFLYRFRARGPQPRQKLFQPKRRQEANPCGLHKHFCSKVTFKADQQRESTQPRFIRNCSMLCAQIHLHGQHYLHHPLSTPKTHLLLSTQLKTKNGPSPATIFYTKTSTQNFQANRNQN